MLESLPVALLLGSVLGFLSGLGVGGGSLLILWLTLALDMEPGMARAINLMFFIPSALISVLFRWRSGNLKWKTILPAVISGCAAAVLFGHLFGSLELIITRRLFGGLLLFTGLRELFFKKKTPSS